MSEPQILTVQQVAKLLQLHEYTILGYIKNGKLKASKFGRVYRVTEDDLQKFLSDNSTVNV